MNPFLKANFGAMLSTWLFTNVQIHRLNIVFHLFYLRLFKLLGFYLTIKNDNNFLRIIPYWVSENSFFGMVYSMVLWEYPEYYFLYIKNLNIIYLNA